MADINPDELVDLSEIGIDPLSADALRSRLRGILGAQDLDPDTQMRAIVTAVTKLGIDIGVRKTQLPYPLSRGDRLDRMKLLLDSLPADELEVIRTHLRPPSPTAQQPKPEPALQQSTG